MKMFRFAPIGLIDSGIGGLSLLKALQHKYPNENYIYLADNLNMPYGNKSKRWLISRLKQLIDYLYNNFNVKQVILACNTASIIGLKSICSQSPVKVVGLDLSNDFNDDTLTLCTKLCAKGYNQPNIYPCANLASYIEENIFNTKSIKRKIDNLLTKANIKQNNIVLGCTHYELVANTFKQLAPNKNFVLPCQTFVNNLDIPYANLSNTVGDILMLATIPTKSYIDKLWKVFRT